MRILVAPGPYKECLSADEVAEAIAQGVRLAFSDAELTLLPLSDGGTGLTERLLTARGGRSHSLSVSGPMGKSKEAHYAILSDGTAVIESAQAAGLALVPRNDRNPMNSSTEGVGQMVLDAYDRGARTFIVGCGDSATNDAGVGFARALGVKFHSANGAEVDGGGGQLSRISAIDSSGLKINPSDCQFTVACNLSSILAGPDGTSHRYAQQKGATAAQATALGVAVDSYALVLARHLGKDISRLPGTGGAGGLASALYAFVNANLAYSMDIVFRELNVEAHLVNQDLVVTGEGMLDAKTASGKAPCALGLLAKKYDILTLAVVGSIDVDADIAFYHGLDFVVSVIPRPLSIEEACEPDVTRRFIVEATLRTLRSIKRCLPS